MRKKFLAAVMSAVMVACASPVIALAEPVADVETETVTEGTDGTDETVVSEEALTMADTVPTAESGEDVRAGEITDQTSLEAAIANGGTVDLGGKEITLNTPLKVNTSVEIANGTLKSGTGVSGNLVTLGQGINVTLTNVTVNTDASNKHALHAWGTNLTVNGLTISHNASGAPIVVNNGATAAFSGTIDLTLGTNSWYGINVDNATADFSGATLNVNGAAETQSAVCIDNADTTTVTGVNLTEVVTTTDGGDKAKQIAYVADANLPQFVAAKTAAGADVETITLNKDVSLSAPLYLSEAMTVNGNGFSFNGTSAIGKDNVVTVMADGVSLSNVTIKTDAANKSALHIYKSSAVLTDVTLDNTNTVGGAGMIVNGGTADVNGALNIILGANSWGGINVDGKNGASAVNFAAGSKATLQDNSGNSLPVLYVENANVNAVSVSGAEDAGLVQDANGNYVVKAETKPAEDNKPANNNKNDEKKEDKKDGASPKTGDSSALMIALIALAASGAAATVVVRKRNEMSR